MKTIRQSTFAMIIALVSTAALGPGTIFPAGVDQMPRQDLSASTLPAPAPNDFMALLQAMENAGPSELATALLGMDRAGDEAFMAVDIGRPSAQPAMPVSGERGVRSGWSPLAGMNVGGNDGYGTAGQGLPGVPGMQLARRGASLTGVSTGTASGSPEGGPSVIALDDPALMDRDIQQLPASFVSPTPAGLEGNGESAGGVGSAAGSGNAVPEPATVMLVACGLLGLLAARRKAGPTGRS